MQNFRRGGNMKAILIGAAIAFCFGIVSAADKPEPPKSGCDSGEPWKLPPSKPKDLGQQSIVLNAPQAIRVRLCNCTGARKADSYVMVNAYRAEAAKGAVRPKPAASGDLPNSNMVSRLYAGSCLEAGGTDIYLRNPSESDPADGVYDPR